MIMDPLFKNIEGITFDLFNTLMATRAPPRDFKAISEYLVSNGIEIYPQELSAARQYVFFHDMPKYAIKTWEEWASQILKRLDTSAGSEVLNGFIEQLGGFSKNLYLFDDVIETLEKLSKKYILSIVTTIPEFQFEDIIEPIRKYFKIIVTGANARCAKGNPKMYKFDLDKKGVSPTQNLFVGDDPIYDIHYPKKLGMRVIEIARNHVFQSEEAEKQITTLKELESLLL